MALSDPVGAEHTNVVDATRKDIKNNLKCMTKEG